MGTPNTSEVIKEALDKLALALVDHNHQWTDDERKLYDEAMRMLTS